MNQNSNNQNPQNNFQQKPNNIQKPNNQNVPQNKSNNFQQQRSNNPNPQRGNNPYQEKLRVAYEIYLQADRDFKSNNIKDAIDKFSMALTMVNIAYPNIANDKTLKQTTDQFRAQIEKGIKQAHSQSKLSMAYDIFYNAEKDYKNFSLNEALEKYEKALNIVKAVYPNIESDKNLKETTDKFKAKIENGIKNTSFQIKNRYEYKPTAGFAVYKTTKINYYDDYSDDDSNYVVRDKYAKKVIKQKSNNNTNTNSSSNNQASNTAAQKKEDEKKVVGNELRERVLSEIVDSKPGVKFTDVCGLIGAKQILREIIIIPSLRPDLFQGLRSPPRGLLLFGPPGTGKTMIAKAVATECSCTFFNISASSLTSKYLGESEKLVRALFDLAFEKSPSVVFIDEIESILCKRSDNENEAMKRLKTEFLVQFDGVGSTEEARVLIIGATNRPFDLDPAVVRRLPKRVYIGPFDENDKKNFIKKIVEENESVITDEQFGEIAKLCTNYSNSDLKELCREAAYEPLREISDVQSLQNVGKLRPICYEDFLKAVKKVRGTLTKEVIQELKDWNDQFGALR